MIDTRTLTIAEFLEQRITEDEAAARAAFSPSGVKYEVDFITDLDQPAVDRLSAHIARHDPARVLAECAAKREVVEMHSSMLEAYPNPKETCCQVCSAWGEYPGGYPCPTLRALASVYADHPAWREEWR